MRKEDSLIVQKIIRRVIDTNNNSSAKVVGRISAVGYNIQELNFLHPKVHITLDNKDFEVTEEDDWISISLTSGSLDKSRLQVYSLRVEPGREWEKTNIGDIVDDLFEMIDVHVNTPAVRCPIISFNILNRSVKTNVPQRRGFAKYDYLKNGKGVNIPIDDIQGVYSVLVGYRWAEIDNPVYDALRHIAGRIEVRYKKR